MAMLETKAMLYLGEIIYNRKGGGEGEDNRDGDQSQYWYHGDGKGDCHIGGKIDGEVDGDDGGDGFHVLPIVFHSSNTSSAPSPITHLQHGQWSMIDG